MQKLIVVSKHLICAIIVAFLFLYSSKYVLSEEAEKSQSQQTPEMKGYNYNLKDLLKDVEQNLKEVDKKLKEEEVKKLNEQREVEIRKHFEKGNQLYQEGKFKEAKQEWQKTLQISKDPQMKDYIQKTEARAREEELARKKQEQEQQKKLTAEQQKAKQLEAERKLQQEPKKKVEDSSIKPVSTTLKDSQKAREEELARKKEEQEQQKKLQAEAREKEQLEKEKQKQLELEKKQQEQKQKDEEIARKRSEQQKERQLNEQASTLYKAGIVLYNAHKHTEAQAKFNKISQLIPHYSRTDYYLSRLQKDIQKEKEHLAIEKKQQEEFARKEQECLKAEKRQQEELVQTKKIDSIYKNAITLYNKNQFEEASSLFNQILSLDSEHRGAKDYLNRKIPNRVKQLETAQKREEERMQIAEQKRSEKQIQEKKELKKESKAEAKDKKIGAKVEESKDILNETARAIYKEAIALYNSGEYTQAKAKFEQVKQIAPNHPNTDYYLERIPQKIAEHKEWTKAQKKQETKTTKRKEIASLSNEAISFYDEGKLAESADLFKQILSLDPENRRAKFYLENKMPTDVTKLPESEQGKQKEEQAKRKLQQEPKAKVEEPSIKPVSTTLKDSQKAREEELKRKKEEQEQQKKLEAEAIEKELKLKEQAKATYNEAVSLYRSRNYGQAKLKFEQTIKLIPHYARTDYYLKRIPQDIQQEKLEREQNIKQESEEKERERLEKEKQLELQKREQQHKQKERKSVPNRKIESLYKKAISLYDQNQLHEAKVLFLEILSLDPTQPRALDYINNKIPNRSKELQKEDKSR